jgi:large subunit ribosomal protein L15
MAIKLGELKRPAGSTRNRKRIGRGPGSGTGKTSGKGHKGHQARAGYRRKAYHEGGQMPLYRKIPKRGFHNPGRVEYQALNLSRFAKLTDGELTHELLVKKRLVASANQLYKVLGTGDVGRAVVVYAHAFSKTARTKIEAAGGRCEVIT